LRTGDRLFEVGCATGKSTLPLARRGFAISCVELGAELAAAARRNLAGYDVRVINDSFEAWEPDGQFALVYAATSWHWLDPGRKYQLARRALRPGGHLAFWESVNVVPEDGDPVLREIQDVYEEIGEGLPPGTRWPRPGELPDKRAEIETSGLFDDVSVVQYDWERIYTAEEYVGLLSTFSGHISMPGWKRRRLFGEIRRRLAARPEDAWCPAGSVRQHWGAVLHIARRADNPRSEPVTSLQKGEDPT
jgi:SAM-dependent methyltransferase